MASIIAHHCRETEKGKKKKEGMSGSTLFGHIF
jgi:hypothetical protein